MPPRRRRRPKKTPRGSEVDRISDLPDGVLHHVLSFMPAHEAVRTCMLARRWRHIWRSAPAIYFTNDNWLTSADRFNQFVDSLLQLRSHGAPLESCHFHLKDSEFYSNDDEFLADELTLTSWIWHALRRRVRVLLFCNEFDNHISLPERPLLSQHLTRLTLEQVCTNERVLDFSGCPTLLYLQMEDCQIDSETMSSSSLKHLRMIDCVFYETPRTQISLPNLVSLELGNAAGRIPFLESMPSLVTAIVRLDYDCCDRCDEVKSGGCGDDLCDGCQYYYDSSDDRRHSVFLHGLSQATDLELSADPDMIVFKMDLKWCATFSKLNTLVLDELFVTDDLRPLIWFLQHSPVLEKLYLQLPKEHKIPAVTKERYSAIKQSVSSDHLQLVKIKCWNVDDMAVTILKILKVSGIPLEKIQIHKFSDFGGLNFVCTGFSSK